MSIEAGEAEVATMEEVGRSFVRQRSEAARERPLPLRRALACALAALLVLPATSVPVGADSATIASSTLPTGRYATSAVWDGSNFYVFGGHNDSIPIGQIVRYNPTTGTVTAMGGQLPSARFVTSAVWTGTSAFVFGGSDGQKTLNQIVRYNPSTDTVTTMGATLPTGLGWSSAIWTGSVAYVFGGFDGTNYPRQILRYNPATDSLTTMGAQLPPARFTTSGTVWDGTNAYLFGASNGVNPPFNLVVRYNPATDTVTTMSATLPTGRTYTSAIWDGANAYVFAGYDGTFVPQILRYNPAADTVTVMGAAFPTGRIQTSAAWDGSNAYVFGGYDGVFLNQIVRYDAPRDLPRNLTAASGPALGEITLNWEVPLPGTLPGPLTGYKVYRATSSGNETFVASLGPATSYTDSGLGHSTTYYYQVRAATSAGDGNLSNEAKGRTYGTPGAPQNLAATAGPGAGQISLTWTAGAIPGGNLTTYRLYRGTTSGGETFAGNVSVGTTHTDAGLASNASYYYKLSAVNAAGEGPLSGEATARTFAPPSPPQALTATGGPAPGQISLTWQAPATPGMAVTGYRLYRGTSSGSETFVSNLGPATSTTDGNLANNATYYYKLSAVSAVGEGPLSNEATASTYAPPGPPQSLAAGTGPGPGELTLTWQPAASPGTPLTGYRVYRGLASGSETFLTAVGVGASFTDSGLATNTTYYYKLGAVNAVGEGPKSNGANARTFGPPGPPPSLAATAGPGLGQIQLQWQAASSPGTPVTSYKVYRGTVSGGETFLADVNSGTTFSDAGLANTTTYYYKVSAVSTLGEGPKSNGASASTYGPPAAPGGFAASAGPGVRQVSLTWAAASSPGTPVTGYNVYRGSTPGGETFLASLGVVTNYTDAGLADNTVYYYKISAVNAIGEGAKSASANARTFAAPSAPQGVSALPATNLRDVRVTWTAPASNGGTAITNYRVFRYSSALGSGPSTLVATVGPVTNYTDPEVPLGAWSYRVSAVNAVGEGPQSGSSPALGLAT